MCGIAAIVTLQSANRHQDKIKRMLTVLRHRGPDEEGVYLGDQCLLGHTRLKIIDFATGQQPMFSFDKGAVVVFNGEVYGFRDIKKRFLGDYPFRTSSDTEVILALYKKYGINLLKQLPGMFAFVLWDRQKKILFCARDRLGEKPLFYAFSSSGELIVASEIKAIIASKLVEPILNKDQLVYYMQNLYVSPYQTIYKNIFTLPPAHYLIFKEGQVKIIKYWFPDSKTKSIDLDEAKERFKILLEKAIRNQLISDTPAGILLSGGLDSSTIVALAHKINPEIRTLTFQFDSIIDETPYAQAVSDKYKIKNIRCNISNYNLNEVILKMAEIYDEPFADSANIPMYLLSKEAAKYYKVVLSGDGADELLGGYDYWYTPLFIYTQLKKEERYFINGLFFKILSHYIIKRNYLKFYQTAKKLIILKRRREEILEIYINQKKYFHDNEINSLGLKQTLSGLPKINRKNNIDDALLFDLIDYLPGDILVKTDRASMANGLEVRLPFLDYQFVSFCLSLPYHLKLNSWENKILLRRAYQNLWPKKVQKRRKQGLGAPVEYWFKKGVLNELKKEYLENNNNSLYSLLDYQATKQYFNLNNYKTWILLVLSIWLSKNKYLIK